MSALQSDDTAHTPSWQRGGEVARGDGPFYWRKKQKQVAVWVFPGGPGASEKGMDASGSVEPLGMEWAGCMHEAERRPVNLARQLPADGRAAFEIGGAHGCLAA